MGNCPSYGFLGCDRIDRNSDKSYLNDDEASDRQKS
jgi:hypothetical protein